MTMTFTMDDLRNLDLNWKTLLASTAVTVSTLVVLLKIRSANKSAKLRQLWDSRGKDVVTLHMFPRALNCPNISPFVIKLETYLRAADIKYVPDYVVPFGTKGKCPWITVNGVDIPDSQLTIKYLSKEIGKDLEDGLSDSEKAVSRAFRILIEEHFYWASAMERWVYRGGSDFKHYFPPGLFGIPNWFPNCLKDFIFRKSGHHMVLPACKAQGMGRHSKEEVMEIGKEALSSFSAYLGDKPFLLGDRPCLADLSVFSFISLFVCLPLDLDLEFSVHIRTKCKNLLDHHERMATKYWPDYEKVKFGCD